MDKVKKQPQVFIIFRTEGCTDIKKSWVEVRAQELCQYGRMLCSESPILSHDGRKQLQSAAQELHDMKMEVYLERLKHEETRERLSSAGQKGADVRWNQDGSRWGDDDEVRKLIASLAATTDRWGGTMNAKELWPEFYACLDASGLSPEEIGPAATDETSVMNWRGNPVGITFRTFQNMLSIARGLNKK